MEQHARLGPALPRLAHHAGPGSGRADRRRDGAGGGGPFGLCLRRSVALWRGRPLSLGAAGRLGFEYRRSGTPPTDVITGVAPYWRFAYEYDWGQQSLELGTFGLQASLHNPTTVAGNSFIQSLQAGPTDRFTDIGIDTQYQYIDDDNQVTATARAIRENQRLDASFAQALSDNPSNHIDIDRMRR